MTTEITAIQRALESKKQALVRDLENIVGEADHLLKEVADSTSDEFAAVRSQIETRLGEARHRLHDARIVATRKACHAADATQEYVMENPMKVIGVAALAALIAAALLSRR